MKTFIAAGVIALTTLTSGCASIVSGSNQSLSVESIHKGQLVSGATCKLTNDKGTWFLNTPGTVTVRRSYDDLSIRCEKEKIEPGIVTAKSSTKAMMFGNIIFGGIIGGAVDAGTGAAYDYPSIITVQMAATTTLETPKSDQADASGNSATQASSPKDAPNQTTNIPAPKPAALVPVSVSAPDNKGVSPGTREQPGEVARLKTLKDARDAGLITDEEYEKKRTEILRGM